jgi:hypothetical protein
VGQVPPESDSSEADLPERIGDLQNGY